MQITLIHNPSAGFNDLNEEELLAPVRQAGHEVRYIRKLRGNLDEILQPPVDLVVVVGGDGTVGRVAIKLAGSGVPLAVVPAGTANNIANALGITGTLAEQVKQWASIKPRDVSIGLATGRWGERKFVESFGVGLFARTMHNLDTRPDHAQPDHASPEDAFRHACREMKNVLARNGARSYALSLDGVDLSGRYVLIEAMNLALIGPSLHLAPAAHPGDDMLDVVLLPESDMEAFDEYLSRRIDGEKLSPNLQVKPARKLVIDPKGAPLHFDDEFHSESHNPLEPPGPIELGIRSGELTFLVP